MVRNHVPGPDGPSGESAALFRFRRAQLLQLVPVGARLLGQGVEHFQDVGEFLGIVVGGEELLDLLAEACPAAGCRIPLRRRCR
jgi:hypothetical protein